MLSVLHNSVVHTIHIHASQFKHVYPDIITKQIMSEKHNHIKAFAIFIYLSELTIGDETLVVL